LQGKTEEVTVAITQKTDPNTKPNPTYPNLP